MELERNNIASINVNFILTHGKRVSYEEAIVDICPVDWDKELLDGKQRNKTIIKNGGKGSSKKYF